MMLRCKDMEKHVYERNTYIFLDFLSAFLQDKIAGIHYFRP